MRNDRMTRGRAMLAAIAMTLLVEGATAQTAPAPVQGLDTFNLQPSRPTPTPSAVPTVTPTAMPTAVVPVVIVPVPVPSATPTPRAISTPRPESRTIAPAPAATATPEPAVTPTPETTPIAPQPSPTPVPTIVTSTPQNAPSQAIPVWAIVAAVLALGALTALVLFRRRRAVEVETVEEAPYIPPAPVPVEQEPVPVAAPAPRFLEPAPPPPPDRAWIDLSVTARRAGVNLVTATADVEIMLHNSGSAAANAIRLDVRLLSARAGQDDELGALFATPVDRPATPPFDLAPGETRTIRTLATLPRDAINVLTAADRPMFVPILAVNALYATGEDTTGQTAAAYAIGIERDGAAKLAPFWLDGPTRMYDSVAVRPHALALKK